MRSLPRTLIVELVGLRCALEIALSPGQKNNHSLSASAAHAEASAARGRWEAGKRAAGRTDGATGHGYAPPQGSLCVADLGLTIDSRNCFKRHPVTGV